MLAESDDDQTRAKAIRSGLLVHKVQRTSALGWTATEGRDQNSMMTRDSKGIERQHKISRSDKRLTIESFLSRSILPHLTLDAQHLHVSRQISKSPAF